MFCHTTCAQHFWFRQVCWHFAIPVYAQVQLWIFGPRYMIAAWKTVHFYMKPNIAGDEQWVWVADECLTLTGLSVASRSKACRLTEREGDEATSADAGSAVERRWCSRAWCTQPTISCRQYTHCSLQFISVIQLLLTWVIYEYSPCVVLGAL